MWCDVKWSEVMWRDVKWCEVMWCEVKWCEVMWCEVMWSEVKCIHIYIHMSCYYENDDLIDAPLPNPAVTLTHFISLYIYIHIVLPLYIYIENRCCRYNSKTCTRNRRPSQGVRERQRPSLHAKGKPSQPEWVGGCELDALFHTFDALFHTFDTLFHTFDALFHTFDALFRTLLLQL